MKRVSANLSCCAGVLLFNLLLGGWSVDYLLAFAGEDIPFVGDAIVGLIVGEFSVPLAIVAFVLRYFGAI